MSIGNEAKQTSVSRQSVHSMTMIMESMVSTSATMEIMPSEKTSFIDSISLMVRVVRVPIAFRSNQETS